MKVKFTMGPFEETEELPDGLNEDQIQEAFETWLWNRSDIGWHLIEGEVSE